MFYQTIAEAKKTARSLARNTPEGVEISYSQALDIVAALHGCEDWNAFSAKSTKQGVDLLLADHERAHAWDSEEANLRAHEQGETGFGPEVAIVAHTGFRLQAPAFPAECDYVRVCDPLGRETAYWSQQEWQESPAEVMGAVIGALARGKAPTKPIASVESRKVTLRDVDLEQVTAVKINNVVHRVQWCEAAPAQRLKDGGVAPLAGDEDDIEVLTISAEDRQGFPEISWLWWSDLVDLKWSSTDECFVAPNGDTYTFFFETKFAPGA